MTKIFLVAGEASGDQLGGALMEGLLSLDPSISFAGVGGARMQAHGLSSLFPMQELSVMGLAEVLPKYRHLKRRIAETAQAVLDQVPDVLLTIDSPDFCLRVARIVREANPGIRTVHYVAPSVWAWRPGRAEKMAKVIDQVLALLPFEPPYMEAAGMRCDFVGHPVVAEPQATDEEAQAFRTGIGVEPGAPLVLVLPGSRRGEISRLGARFGDALGMLREARGNSRFVLPVAPGMSDLVAQMTETWPVPVTRLDPAEAQAAATKRAAFGASDVALAASGTVSLELAAAQTPMVIGYDMAWLTRQIMARMIRVDTVTLVNLVSETRAIPEFLGADCTPDALFEALNATLVAPDEQVSAARLTMERLGKGGKDPGLRAAEAVLDGLYP